MTSKLNSAQSLEAIRISIIGFKKGGWTLTGPAFFSAPVLLALGRELEYNGFSIGPKGELPVEDLCDCKLEDEPEYVPANGPLTGDDPLDILGELLPPAKVIPAGRVLAPPTLILGLYVLPKCPQATCPSIEAVELCLERDGFALTSDPVTWGFQFNLIKSTLIIVLLPGYNPDSWDIGSNFLERKLMPFLGQRPV